MSLLNAWVTPTEALVAVDTEGVRRDGSRTAMAKLLPLSHLNAVLGFRGESWFSAGVLHGCVASGFDTFDTLLDALSEIAEDVDAAAPALLHGPGYGDIGNEFIAVGWSPGRMRMFARTFVKRGAMDRFTVRDSNGCIAPWDEDAMGHLPKAADAVERIAEAQVRWMRGQPGAIGGGALIICRITRASMSIHHQLKFQPEESTA